MAKRVPSKFNPLFGEEAPIEETVLEEIKAGRFFAKKAKPTLEPYQLPGKDVKEKPKYTAPKPSAITPEEAGPLTKGGATAPEGIPVLRKTTKAARPVTTPTGATGYEIFTQPGNEEEVSLQGIKRGVPTRFKSVGEMFKEDEEANRVQRNWELGKIDESLDATRKFKQIYLNSDLIQRRLMFDSYSKLPGNEFLSFEKFDQRMNEPTPSIFEPSKIGGEPPSIRAMNFIEKAESGLLSDAEKERQIAMMGAEKFNENLAILQNRYRNRQEFLKDIIESNRTFDNVHGLEGTVNYLGGAIERGVKGFVGSTGMTKTNALALGYSAISGTQKGKEELAALQAEAPELSALEKESEKGVMSTIGKVAGDLAMYGTMGVGLGATSAVTRALPKGIARFANNSPHLYDFVVGGLASEAVASGVAKIKNEDYGYQDFLLGMAMNGLGEGLAKALGSRKVKITGDDGEKVASKFTHDDIEKIDNAVKIEYSKNPYATVTEIQDAINSVKLSNGKSVGELWYDVKSQKASAEFVEGAVRASDVGKIRTAESAIPTIEELGTTAKSISAQPGKEVSYTGIDEFQTSAKSINAQTGKQISPEEVKIANLKNAEDDIATAFGGRTTIKHKNKDAAVQKVMEKHGVTKEEADAIVRNVIENNKPWNRNVNEDFNILLGASILGEGDKMPKFKRPHNAIDASLPKDLKYDNAKTKDFAKAQAVKNLVENGMLEISTPTYKNGQTLLSFKVTNEARRFLPNDKVEKIASDMQFVHIPESHYKLTEGGAYSKPYAKPEVDERMGGINFLKDGGGIEQTNVTSSFTAEEVNNAKTIGNQKYGSNFIKWSTEGRKAEAFKFDGMMFTGTLGQLIKEGKTTQLIKELEKYVRDLGVVGMKQGINVREFEGALEDLVEKTRIGFTEKGMEISEEIGKEADLLRLGKRQLEQDAGGLASIERKQISFYNDTHKFFHELSHILNTYLPNDVIDVIQKDFKSQRDAFVSELSGGNERLKMSLNYVLDNYFEIRYFMPDDEVALEILNSVPGFYRFTNAGEFFADNLAEAMVRGSDDSMFGKIKKFILGIVESILNKSGVSARNREKFFDKILSDFRNGRIQLEKRDSIVMRGDKSIDTETGIIDGIFGKIRIGLKSTKEVGTLEIGYRRVDSNLSADDGYPIDYLPTQHQAQNVDSVKSIGINKQILDGGVTEASVREYLAKNGILSVPSRTSNRISKILNFVEELSQKATKSAESIDDAINAAMRPVSNAYEGFRSEYLQRVVALGDDIDIYKVRKIEKELGEKYGIKSLPRDSKAEISAADIIDNGWRLVARAGKTKKDFFETAKKLFELSSGNDAKRLLQKWSEETDMKNLEPELRKYAEERGVKLDETKLGDADYVYNVIKEGDDRLFKNATANILKRVSNKYRKTEEFAQLQVEKLSNLKNLRAGAKEIKGMVNALFDTEFRMLPKYERERLVAFANEKALNLKSLERGNSTALDNPENIISKVAEKAARAEYKFLDKSIQDNVNDLFKAATDDDKVFIGGHIEQGYEAFKNEGDLEILRKTLAFLENVKKEGMENVKKNRFFMDSMVESALHSFTGGVKLNGRYGLRDGLTPNGGEIIVGGKGTQATFTSRTKFGLSMIDMPSRVLKATFGRDSFFYNRIYMPVVRAQKAAEGEIARFQQYIGYEGLKRDDMYSLMVYMNAKQSDGYQALLGAANLQVDKTTRKIITGNLSDRIKIKTGRMEAVQITEADINAIVHRVENDKKLKSVADRIFATTYDLGQRITNIAKMFGESFSAGENYIPRFYLRGEFEGTLGEVDKNMGSFSITEMDKSFFKPRTGVPKGSYELNMDFVSMIREIEKHILFANLRVPLKIFSDVAYKSDDYVSKGTKKYLNILTEEYATQGASRERFGNNVIRGLERLGAFRALTSFKSVLMQFTSAFDVLGGTGIYDAFRTDGNIKRFMDNLSIARLHSGALNRRRATDLPDVAARAKLEGSTTRAIQEVESLLHAPMKGADAMTFNVSWMNFYSKFMREKRGFKGMVDLRTQGIDMEALDYADEMSEEFLSSTRVGSTPLGYRNPYVRMMTFLGKSQLNSFMNMLDTINAKDLEGTPGEVYAYKARVAMGYALSRSTAALVGYANFYFWNQYYQEKVKKGEAVTMSDLNEFQTKVLKQTEDYIDGKLKVTELDEVGKYLVSDMVYQMLPHAALKDVLTYTAKNLPNDFDEAFSQKALLSNPVIDFIKNVSNIGTILAPKEDEEVQHSLSAQITQALTFVMPSFVASAVKIEGRTEDYKFKVSKGFEGRLDEGSTYEEYKQQIINKADNARINKTYKDWEKEAYKKVFRNPQELLDEIAKAPAEVKHKLDLGRIVNGKFVPSPEVEGDYLTKFAENQFTSYVEKRILNSNDWNKKFKYGDETLLKFVAPSVSVEDFYDWKLRGKDAKEQTIVIKKLYNMVDVFGKVQGNDVKVPFESKIKSLEDYAKKTRYYEYKASQKQ